MKRSFLFALTVAFAFGCSENNSKTDAVGADSSKMSTATTTQTLEYPYQLEQPYADWQPGDKNHAVTAMKSLKAFEMNNVAEAVSYFGDTLDIRFDNFHKKVPHDSLLSLFTMFRNEYKDIKIKMGDWESVISADKKLEYVTLWYKQIFTDKNGKTDSLGIVDDFKIKNGKIIELDEKIQRFEAKK